MKLCVFPNDPIRAYYEKGEIKENYFNPENIFDEVHIISFTDKDIEEFKVQKIVGNAKLVIHAIGKINIKNRKKEITKVIDIVKKISPDVIRTYNPLRGITESAISVSDSLTGFKLVLLSLRGTVVIRKILRITNSILKIKRGTVQV